MSGTVASARKEFSRCKNMFSLFTLPPNGCFCVVAASYVANVCFVPKGKPQAGKTNLTALHGCVGWTFLPITFQVLPTHLKKKEKKKGLC